MKRVTRLAVEGLFGHVDHVIDIRPNAPTIITAPNGAGKTHLLMLMRSALGLDIKSLAGIAFKQLRIDLDSDQALVIRKSDDEKHGLRLTFISLLAGRQDGGEAVFTENDLAEMQQELPPYMHQLSNGRWFDSRTDRVMSSEMLERRFSFQLRNQNSEKFRETPAILSLFDSNRPILIDTKRLDAVVPLPGNLHEPTSYHNAEASAGAARINEYINQLRKEVTEARRSSIQATQSADLSFAARAIAAADKIVNEEELHKRYDHIVDRYENLTRNALAIGEAPMEFPAETTSTVRTILNVFLDDWERRLEPLLPLNEKIMTLRDILDTKLKQSGKSTAMSPQGGLAFKTFLGRRIRVSSLSSGEQHLVALFTLLLFSAKPGSLVLIDEPEISLHAAWKHAFLKDISRVAELANLQIVLATHSTAIINGRWDLVEELKFPSSNQQAPTNTNILDTDPEMDDLLDQ